MVRLYERLAGLNAMVGVLALVLGLAMAPSTAQAAAPPNDPGCGGSCNVQWSLALNACQITNACTGSTCVCLYTTYRDLLTGEVTDCYNGYCGKS